MTAAERDELKRRIDAYQRKSVADEKARRESKPCQGCGGRLDLYTAGCNTCRTRRNSRAARAVEARRAMVTA